MRPLPLMYLVCKECQHAYCQHIEKLPKCPKCACRKIEPFSYGEAKRMYEEQNETESDTKDIICIIASLVISAVSIIISLMTIALNFR